MHVLVPEYVPAIVELLTPLAVPWMLIVHPGKAETPPAGTVIVKLNVVPDSVPVMLPLN